MRYLGIDFGLRRIGLAVSEGELASPWEILEVRNFSDAVEKVSKVVSEGSFDKIIVGQPEGKMGQNVKGFVSALKKQGFEVQTQDETLSSKEAQDRMIAENIPQKKRRNMDSYSAAIILQNYLDEKS